MRIVREGARSGRGWMVEGSKVIGMFIDGKERRPYILNASQEGQKIWQRKQSGR